MDVFTSKKFKLIFVFRFICLDFTRCLCSLKTPQCNRIRHPTYVTIEYVLKITLFFNDSLDVCYAQPLGAKNQTNNNKLFFLRRYLLRMRLAHGLSTDFCR